MNELHLKEMNQDRIVYLYQPEGRGEHGEIVYEFAYAQATISKRSKDDEYGRYANKAVRKVEECVKNNNLPLKLIQAWY